MARPQKVSDDEILGAAFRVMQRVGPSEFSLATIAEEAGVTPGLLVQRFGSKHELQVRLAEAAAGMARDSIRELRTKHESPLATVRAYVACFAEMTISADAFARNLSYLTEDLSDPELRAHLARQSRATRDAIEELLAEAVANRELTRTTDVKRLARTIEAVIGGSMISWATYRVGRADRWMLSDLDGVLEPYRTKARR